MAFRMARPMRRKGTTYIQLRKRIPSDVLLKARGAVLLVPVGDEARRIVVGQTAETVAVSLRTREPREAKERQAIAIAYLDSFWQSLRTGPVSLTHKQIVALAGEAYRELVAAFEDNPGHAGAWEAVIRLHASKMASDLATLEEWYGPTIDEVLARHRLIIDAQSREALFIRVGMALVQAADRLRRNAQGDYSADEVVDRFPSFTRPDAPRPTVSDSVAKGQTITGLVDSWWSEAKAAGKAYSTYEAYERTARQLVDFLGHNDASAVTTDDVIRYKDHRLENGASLKTIGGSDLSGIRSLYKWGVANRKVAHNPVTDVRVIVPKRSQVRSKGFTDDEARTLLAHSLRHRRGRESANMSAAKRWVPWLCAYTGARLGEMVQLRKQDLRNEGGHWIITITPEAVTVKDKDFREVPLHPHLVEMGFPDFVSDSDEGFLFFKPSLPQPLRPKSAPGQQLIEVELPDGTIVEFPADTPQEVMLDALRRQFPPMGPKGPRVGASGITPEQAQAELDRRKAAREGSKIFKITAPDGKTYKVTGDNEEGALNALRTYLGDAAAQEAPSGDVSPNNLVRSLATGVPVIGGVLNNMNAATNATLAPLLNPIIPDSWDLQGDTFGERYERSLGMQEGMDAAFEEQHPYLDTGLNVADAVV